MIISNSKARGLQSQGRPDGPQKALVHRYMFTCSLFQILHLTRKAARAEEPVHTMVHAAADCPVLELQFANGVIMRQARCKCRQE
jgi:hypothetical protein